MYFEKRWRGMTGKFQALFLITKIVVIRGFLRKLATESVLFCYYSAITSWVFTIRLFLKSQRKNREGLLTDVKHSMCFTFLAIFEKHRENLRGFSCLRSGKTCRTPTLLNNNLISLARSAGS